MIHDRDKIAFDDKFISYHDEYSRKPPKPIKRSTIIKIACGFFVLWLLFTGVLYHFGYAGWK